MKTPENPCTCEEIFAIRHEALTRLHQDPYFPPRGPRGSILNVWRVEYVLRLYPELHQSYNCPAHGNWL